jgi:hypothetical protein
MSDLLLRRASEPRPGAEGLDDYDVIGMEGEIVGRIFKVTRFPNDLPWQWSLAYGLQEDRILTHGDEATREMAMQAAFARSWHRES